MILDKSKLNKSKGYLEGTVSAVDEVTAKVASDYKKNVCKNFIAINPEQIDSRIAGEEFFITRKYDGEMSVIFYNGTDTFIVNTGGTLRQGLPCTEEAGKLLKSAGIGSAIIPAELYLCEDNGRTRVFDVLSALSKETEIGKLKLAPFDIIEIDGVYPKVKGYGEIHERLSEIFKDGINVKPVAYKKAASKAELKDVYKKWVEEDCSEGLVLRTDLPLVYKIKPKHNIDTVIVGYTEGTGDSKGQIRTLLLALMTGDNEYQIVGKTGNGFNEEQKKDLLTKLSGMVIDSDYIETDSNHVAFRMIKPETVIEISYNDVLFESGSTIITNPMLEISDGKYKLKSFNKGISFIYPIFVRLRPDKTAEQHNLRLSQLSEVTYIPELGMEDSGAELPKSELQFREVYKKESKGKLMVQKFIVWKTNKEEIDDRYPAYVMHYTNFSSDRKDPLQRDMRVSNSREQIFEILDSYMTENIKKGWVKA
ncbi:ATP-dependent DNA ligase [Pseudobacteroides cellulosolvens]|uniref:DNA ligase (ATP) n=1 Tax=Pseudobacteroides cellulosolvens ATCC 35603 = DSM 2933 TaxID=398512 RepID=A0A0L6JPY2_9FIRM|nr:ATP-dependent DNA ligase [Pseudobacteroides cellulosolvens]KNY27442.1 ATP dependent DNA ligase domain protein [Pseudobacteroides cellulosolvens ATCC 35603 = DSM 2933]